MCSGVFEVGRVCGVEESSGGRWGVRGIRRWVTWSGWGKLEWSMGGVEWVGWSGGGGG